MTTANQARSASLASALQTLLKTHKDDVQRKPAPSAKHGASGSATSTIPGEPHFCGSLEDAIEYLNNLGPLDARVSVFLSKKGTAQ